MKFFFDREINGSCFSNRRVESLSLEGCSLLTTEGLGSVILSWKELQSLSVVSCKNIKDSEISLSLSTFAFKELKWRPDTKSLLRSSLVGTGMGKKGSKFFNKRM
jgi:F-box/leucine-rich repeat protein 2/20